MIHLPNIIADLGLILAAGGITTLLFKKIKQPLVLGYILAGLLVSPHVKIVPTVSDPASIHIWAEIGVIFLLFSLGLEFSFKKLIKVGGASSITALVEIVGMSVLGYFVGRWMGWAVMDSVFLGAILSVSSTTIIIRAFEELGVKHKKFAGLVFGALIVEDLAAILIMVILTTVAVSQQFAGMEMLSSIFKLSFFLILWFVGGIFIIPSFLKATKKLMNDETLLVVSLALCLVMVILAVQVGFSPALGAFIMGSILAETTQAEKIEHLLKPVKDLFGVIFFVSVGMLIDPKLLIAYWQPVVIITVVTIIGKILTTGGGALLSGQPLKTSVQTGASLTQIGEFSFIIATLGLTLKVTSDFIYPITVAVSAITTFTTPYLIKYSENIYRGIDKALPLSWKKGIDAYTDSAESISVEGGWKIYLRAYVFNMIIYSVILLAITLFAVKYVNVFVHQQISHKTLATALSLGLSLMIMAPFLWALAFRRIQKTAYTHLWFSKKYARGPLVTLEILRIALSILLIGILIRQFFTTFIAFAIGLALVIVGFAIFSQRLKAFYHKIEKRFMLNLHEREQQNNKAGILPWDTHLTEIQVDPQSEVVGKTLSQLMFREKYGVNVALIERGALKIPIPQRDEYLYPFDKLMLVGSDEDLAKVKLALEPDGQQSSEEDFPQEAMSLQKILVGKGTYLLGKSLREAAIRERAQALIVGVERNAEKILNPPSDFVFNEGDVIWLVGNAREIKQSLLI